MDSSPETNKLPVSSSSHSPAVQESPFFNYLRTLSPIKPVKAAAHVSQVFPELSIPPPPPVFTSPRLNPQSEAFLNRSKFSDSPNATLSTEHEDEGHTLATGSDVSERSTSRLMVGLVSCTKKACETKGSPQIQPCSPPGLVDEYLADPIEVDGSVTSSDPADPHFNQIENRPKASLNGQLRLKETTSTVESNNDNTMPYMEIGSDVQIASLDQTKEGLQGKSLSFLESGKMKFGKGKSLETQDVLSEKIGDVGWSDSSLKPSLGEQKAPHVETQSAEGVQDGRGDTYTQELSGILQIDELAGGPSQESVENKAVDLEEVGQQQRGTLRRCLQFESSGTHTKFSTSDRAYSNSASISRCLSVPAISTNLEMLDSSQMGVVPSSNNCTVSSSQSMPCKPSLCSANTGETHVHNFDRSVQNGGNSSRKIPVPSGIGLHLNSVVNTAAMGSTKSLIVRPEEPRSSSNPSTVIGNVSAKSRGNQQESQLVVAEGSLASQFFCDNADRFQEFNQQSPRYKRKRIDCEDEGCKRCNCKRSKCLKLYCECFAAGIYCAEPCACHECFNKPAYEDMVLETRRQIQSRNPLAFVPKIVSRVTDSPANSGEENNKVTPASARHKRGCNCKKSMCLKKYCECFQSGVGCSVGCRCDGCRNTFGVKEGYGQFSGMARKVDNEIWEDPSDGRVVMDTRSKLLYSEHSHSHNLTPPTPSFQCSVHRKDMPKSRFPGRRYLPSPDSDATHAQSPSSPRNMNAYERRAKMADGNMDIIFDQDMEFTTSGRMDQFSPKWDRFDDICNLTPLSQASSKASRVQLQGSIRLSGSLRWRSSPVTPMPSLGENKVCQEPDSDIASDMLEDETPDILKDTHTPVKTVKVSSPNQKRITPPHNHLHNLRSSPSPGLKSGRKFVLQSISSFPPLTPYSDPKDVRLHFAEILDQQILKEPHSGRCMTCGGYM